MEYGVPRIGTTESFDVTVPDLANVFLILYQHRPSSELAELADLAELAELADLAESLTSANSSTSAGARPPRNSIEYTQ